MKTEEEIIEEIETLKKRRDVYVVETVMWKVYDFAIKELEWVIK